MQQSKFVVKCARLLWKNITIQKKIYIYITDPKMVLISFFLQNITYFYFLSFWVKMWLTSFYEIHPCELLRHKLKVQNSTYFLQAGSSTDFTKKKKIIMHHLKKNELKQIKDR